METQFGDRLDAAAREHIRQQFVGMVAQGRALTTYPLRPEVEPSFVFSPLRKG
jgi:ClpP class serine protease